MYEQRRYRLEESDYRRRDHGQFARGRYGRVEHTEWPGFAVRRLADRGWRGYIRGRRRVQRNPDCRRADVARVLSGVRSGDYVAMLAYLPPSDDLDRRLSALQGRLRDRLRVAVTAGYGPRYLHSTGQLHKGGPARGHFILIVPPVTDDLPIPGETFTFGRLIAAQAEGDYVALEARCRPVLWLRAKKAMIVSALAAAILSRLTGGFWVVRRCSRESR